MTSGGLCDAHLVLPHHPAQLTSHAWSVLCFPCLAVSGWRQRLFHLLAWPSGLRGVVATVGSVRVNVRVCEWFPDCLRRLAPCSSAPNCRRPISSLVAACHSALVCLDVVPVLPTRWKETDPRKLTLHPSPCVGRRGTPKRSLCSTGLSQVVWPTGTRYPLGPSAYACHGRGECPKVPIECFGLQHDRRARPTDAPADRGRRASSRRVATWLILPVVICLSQRLSHACVSMN